ncbi:SDR family NAD(P)-dependent oxidoreductase [Actinomadura sp. NPDC047616]|uniref:SDR family NAD(P)-dependent oxidoreductase n=1 Tax=Actinomadura sp. NPDC047616 TaxID=3155914 RepID=UPI0033C163BD
MAERSYLAELFSLDGKVAVVTGGSSGIGRAIAEAPARAGARVVVIARREEPLAETVRELESHGCRAAWVSADLGSRPGVRTAADEAANAALALASPDMSFQMGVSVLVDGGAPAGL